MRDWVTGAQSKSGHTAGSWHYTGPDRGSTKGGRLYDTAMSSMCLEVYYRHMPLGSKRAMEEAGRVKKEMAAAKAKKTEEKKEEL